MGKASKILTAFLVILVPRKSKTQDPSSVNESTMTSNRSQDQLLGTPAVRPDEKLKKTYVKRDKSISVGESSPPLSKRSCRKGTSCNTGAEPKGREYQDDLKGPKKSFVVPRCKETKAELPTSCTDSSRANLLPSGHPSEKDSLNKDGTFRVVLNKVTMSHEELVELRAFGDDEEEILGSSEMAVFAEAKNYSPEDFSMDLYEE